MSKKIAFLGLSLSAALIFGYIETLIPIDIGIPGVKIGFANIAVLVLLYTANFKTAVFVNFLRIVIIGIAFGGATKIIISASGALFAMSVMWILKKLKFHIITVSAVAGVAHNLGQTVAAAFVMNTAAVRFYIPLLILTGLVSGILIGFISNGVIKRLVGLKQRK